MRIYCDHNATTPIDPRAREAMEPWLSGPTNASSMHAEGRAARRAVEEAREQVAALFGAESRDIVFTSGATEANNMALGGVEPTAASGIEHPSVLEPLRRSQRWLPLATTKQGEVDMASLAQALEGGCRAAALMATNNETGVRQPWRAAAALCAARGARLHIDAVQEAGKGELAVEAFAGLTMSISGHKLGGPQGVGALWIAPETRVPALILGGAQERMRRAGTENVAAIVGFGVACLWAQRERCQRAQRLREAEEQFLASARTRLPDLEIHGLDAPLGRAAGTLSLRVAGLAAETLVIACDLEGLALSLGSACSSGAARPSHVLEAMGVPLGNSVESLRVSLAPTMREGHAGRAGEIFSHVAARLRARR
jgi:cysteine desulfurase